MPTVREVEAQRVQGNLVDDWLAQWSKLDHKFIGIEIKSA